MTSLYAWQQNNWRKFTYDKVALERFEQQFLHTSGIIIGIRKSLAESDKEATKLSFLFNEALNTSEIEGEILDRDSLQSSIQRYFELKEPISKKHPRENGVAAMMVNLYLSFDQPLSHDMLFNWHGMLMNSRMTLESVGKYRTHKAAMQIVSHHMNGVKIHYEAPPSGDVANEMGLFINWFNDSRETLSPLIRAGVAHAYFELIHPFEDGNGRLGRALIEKSLAQSLGQPTFIAVSQTIQSDKKAYYKALSSMNKSNDMTDWLAYFCGLIVQAQKFTIDSVEFLIKKTRFFDKKASQLNPRQMKLLKRILREDIKEFAGGVSVKNYISITKTSPATANRDLNDLVSKGIMHRTGKLKTTRYWLQID